MDLSRETQANGFCSSQDNAEWDPDALAIEKPAIDQGFEAGRADLKRQAQEWAGLEQNPNAELFVFVGRWSLQKGVDLIADIFPWVLEQYPQTQLIVSTCSALDCHPQTIILTVI